MSIFIGTRGREGRTVDPLAKFYYLPQRHRFAIFRCKMRKYTRPKCNLLVQVSFSKAILAELEF